MIKITQLIENICSYLSDLYDMEYKQINDILFVKNNDSIFKLNLKDGGRFNKYVLYHKNHVKDNPGWHVQLRSKSLFKILFFAFGHDFHKYNGIWITTEDINRFKSDIIKLYG